MTDYLYTIRSEVNYVIIDTSS